MVIPLLFASIVLSLITQASNTTASLRGVSVAGPQVAWASGTGGTFLRTTDGGANWQVGHVAGAERLDFRDVEAFDGQTALLMAAGLGEAARVYKTVDAGAHWNLVLQNQDAKGFFDAFAFWDHRHGILLGDPVAGRFTIFRTEDGGDSWTRGAQPAAGEGEGAFAASGTCITVGRKREAWFGTGGVKLARVFHTKDGGNSWSVAETSLAGTEASAGVFSVAFEDSRRGFAVGGDYKKPTEAERTLAVTRDGGKIWIDRSIPSGFRSAVMPVTKQKTLILAVGASGADFSNDDGLTWKKFSDGNFNAVAGFGDDIWAVGPKGLVAKLSFGKR